MAMASHECTEAKVVVDIVIAIEIAEVRALTFLDENGVGIISAIVAGNAQRQPFQVALVSFGGFRRAALESFELLLQFGIHQGSPGILRPCGPSDYARAAGSRRGLG